jgi:two-component system cell cycle response regulator DivK
VCDLSQKHVLIVEDEPRNAMLAVAMLSIIGVTQVRTCRSGVEILPTAAQMARIDLVLLDLQLPGEDGYQILARLRQESAFKETPIIAVTAQMMPDDVARAEAVGFNGFLGKPLHFDRFPDQIRRLFSGQRVWDPR